MDDATAAAGPERHDPVPAIRLGLIGGNIRQSRSPDLHRLCGELTGLNVTYELLIPAELGTDFDSVFDACARAGMRGVNVTYPYKEHAVTRVDRLDRHAAAVGSVNTVVFQHSGSEGYNTDYTGFIAAYRQAFQGMHPGRVALIGAGGVGRAIAFALAELGATDLRLLDSVAGKAAALAGSLRTNAVSLRSVTVCGSMEEVLAGVDGVINATPVGMTGYDGSPVPAGLLGPQRWAFDAVYTPIETTFKQLAEAAGLSVLSGYALFLHQGIDAFRLFTGSRPNNIAVLEERLRRLAPTEKV